MSEVRIRRATVNDVHVVLSLFAELERGQGAFRMFEIAADAEERFRASFRAAATASDACFLIAEDDSGALGMAHCRVERPSKLSDARVVEIGRVVVLPRAREKGIGRALVDAARDFAAELGIETLSARVFSRNTAGLRFWENLGFEGFVEILVREG